MQSSPNHGRQQGSVLLAGCFLLLALAAVLAGWHRHNQQAQSRLAQNIRLEQQVLSHGEAMATAADIRALSNLILMAMYGADLVIGAGYGTAAIASMVDGRPALATLLLLQGYSTIKSIQEEAQKMIDSTDTLTALFPAAILFSNLETGNLPLPLALPSLPDSHQDGSQSSAQQQSLCAAFGDKNTDRIQVLGVDLVRADPVTTLLTAGFDLSRYAADKLDEGLADIVDQTANKLDGLTKPLIGRIQKQIQSLSFTKPEPLSPQDSNKLFEIPARMEHENPRIYLAELTAIFLGSTTKLSAHLRSSLSFADLLDPGGAGVLPGADLAPELTSAWQHLVSLLGLVVQLIPSEQDWHSMISASLRQYLSSSENITNLKIQPSLLEELRNQIVIHQVQDIQASLENIVLLIQQQIAKVRFQISLMLKSEGTDIKQKGMQWLRSRLCSIADSLSISIPGLPLPMPGIRHPDPGQSNRLLLLASGLQLRFAESVVLPPDTNLLNLRPGFKTVLHGATLLEETLFPEETRSLLPFLIFPR